MQEELQHHQVTPPPKSEWWSTDIHESTEQDRENCKIADCLEINLTSSYRNHTLWTHDGSNSKNQVGPHRSKKK